MQHRGNSQYFIITINECRASLVVQTVKNLPVSAGDIKAVGSISGSGRSPAGGHGNSVQYSCLGNPMGRGAWRVTVHGATKNWTQLSKLNNNNCTFAAFIITI